MRVRVLALLALLVMAVLTGCGGSDEGGSGDGGGGGASGEPLRIALVAPSSGPLEVFGQDAVRGWELAAEEANANGGVDGHQVELIKADTDGAPPTTLRAVRRAATQEQAGYVSAIFTSPEHGALQPQLEGLNMISINGIGQDESLTGENCSPNAFRTVQSASMNSTTVGESLEELPGKKWAVIAADYNTGQTAAKGFKAAVEASGGSVVSEQFSPLGTTEYGSYITKLKNSGADALFMYVIGSDAVAFINQGAQFKLFEQFETVLGQNVVSEPLFEPLGEKIVGFYNNLGYSADLDTPRNQAFVEAYEAKFGAKPYYVPADNYLSALALFEAVKKAGSVDPATVREAFKGLEFEGLDGPVTIRPEDGQILRKNYLGQVVKKGDGLGWKIINEVGPDVSSPEPNPACQL